MTLYEKIYAIVRQIPPGKVATYGQIALIISTQHAGRCSARMVGYAMAGLKTNPQPDVPWQRVINRQGRISIHDPYGNYLQRELLEQEGVVFDKNDRIDFNVFGWLGDPNA